MRSFERGVRRGSDGVAQAMLTILRFREVEFET